ncbi:MAG: GIY-YIG nuclease family protein [Leptolyngbya sp. SIO4C5]|nr:GIY-YIG nuclease family protein [Leptolyngbya sp. SIO4C5]
MKMQYCLSWKRRKNRIIPGVYQIRNTITQDCYIGASEYLRRRYLAHKSQLEDGRHSNKLLQAAYSQYGADAFVFELVEECDFNSLQLDERERFWIRQLQPAFNQYQRPYAANFRRGHGRSRKNKF